MDKLTLVIGNKNYSSWSLRPWLAMKVAEIPFAEIKVLLRQPDSKSEILKHSPSGYVPALKAGNLTIWDSLAICEYLAEKFPEANLWPEDPEARARARTVSAEMHSGFSDLRGHMPMDIRSHIKRDVPPAVAANIARIQEIWVDCRGRVKSTDPFLFGHFTIADAMYAPVVTRFQTYGVAVDAISAAYAKAVLDLPAMQEWSAAAMAEKETIG